MGEPPTTQPPRDRTHHPGRLGLLQQLQQPVPVKAAGRQQDSQLKVAAEDGGHF